MHCAARSALWDAQQAKIQLSTMQIWVYVDDRDELLLSPNHLPNTISGRAEVRLRFKVRIVDMILKV